MTGVRKRDDFRCPGLLCPKRLGFGEVLSCNGKGMVIAVIVPYVEIQPGFGPPSGSWWTAPVASIWF